jgi:hypothetical protein
MITHRLSLAETGVGFQLVAAAGESIKVIIEPWRCTVEKNTELQAIKRGIADLGMR